MKQSGFICHLVLQVAFCLVLCQAKLTVSPESIPVNTAVRLQWNNASTLGVNDWIVFTTGGPPSLLNQLSNSWSYVYGDQYLSGGRTPESGSVLVTSPQKPGIYSAYFCLNNSYTCPWNVQVRVTPAVIPPVQCRARGDTNSSVKHVIIVISENHSFDSIYGRYCTAPVGSAPTCTEGPACCERAPTTVSGSTPVVLSDYENGRVDRPHSFPDEACMINGGKMDKFVSGCLFSSTANFACADAISAHGYFSWAQRGAMSDNFFQSSIGASCQNDMYFSSAKFMFRDNAYVPQSPELTGANCYSGNFISYDDPTIADLLNSCGVSWTFYAEGYAVNPKWPQCYGAYYDASDDPFTYFPRLTYGRNGTERFRDLTDLFNDIHGGKLPSVTYVKPLGKNSEHPGMGQGLTPGQLIVQKIIDSIDESADYKENTLVIAVPDESGGFYDHVQPPPISEVDGKLYGPRTQFVVVGHQAKKNYVSHVRLEPSSLIRFIEWNWLAGEPGQLKARDAVVNNIGDLLDPTKTGVPVPSN